MRISRKTRERRRWKMRVMYSILGLLSLTLFSLIGFYIYTYQNNAVTGLFSKDKQTVKTDNEPLYKKEKDQSDNETTHAIKKENEEKDVNAKPITEIIEEEEIKIVFAGDTMFDWELRPILEKKGYDYPFKYIKDTVKKADYSFINIETVFTENPGSRDPNQIFWINSDVRGLHAIKNAGFKMLNLGNNHTLDYLEAGLLDTLKNIEKTNMEYIGAGKNEKEAYESKEIILKGKKIRFFSFVRFFPSTDWVATENKPGVTNGYDLNLVKQMIEEQKGDADYVIVYFHWGIEQTNTPADYQKEYVKELQVMGVDLIVGSHPHWLQGFEYYHGMPVAYSLGNFLFPPYVTGKSAETGLLKATFKGEEIELSFEPYLISNSQIIPPEENIKQEMLEYLQSISYNVEIDRNGNIRNLHNEEETRPNSPIPKDKFILYMVENIELKPTTLCVPRKCPPNC